MEKIKNVNMNIQDGDSFFAHELSVNFNPLQFILDFKNVTPRVDPRSRENIVLNMKHNVIMIDPYHAKKMLELLGTVIKDYEKEFGKIEKPKALEKHEKSMKKKGRGKKSAAAPSYFG